MRIPTRVSSARAATTMLATTVLLLGTAPAASAITTGEPGGPGGSSWLDLMLGFALLPLVFTAKISLTNAIITG